MGNAEKLPRTFMDKVKYQLTLRAFENEWTASYEWADQRFANVTASGRTLDDALTEMMWLFEHHASFENLRHLLAAPDE